MVRISAILLGAGSSKRMGINKLSLPWGKKMVIEQCLGTLLRSTLKEVIVVLSLRDREMADRLERPRVRIVINVDSPTGMSSSIRRGLRETDPKSRGILIALGDQPLVRTQTVNALIRAFVPGKKAIVLPSFQGRRGNPVLFDRWYERRLASLRGDVGGRSVVERYSDKVIEVRTKSEAVLRDIDTWRDYQTELEKRC